MSRTSAPTRPPEELPYSIELWRDGAGGAVERVLARAASSELARAIFKAATTEHPNRRVTLRKGTRTLGDSSR
jgi:hypothetical protein